MQPWQHFLGVNNVFFALDPVGSKKWEFGNPIIEGAPALAADGMVYFGGTGDGGGFLSRWSTDGTGRTDVVLGGIVTGSPAITRDGTVYLGAMNTVCVALKGGAGLAHGGWPKFRGNAAQNGRAAGPIEPAPYPSACEKNHKFNLPSFSRRD